LPPGRFVVVTLDAVHAIETALLIKQVNAINARLLVMLEVGAVPRPA
jgi:hypothetical protein